MYILRKLFFSKYILSRISELMWKPIIGFSTAALIISGCDFVNQVSNLEGDAGDMFGKEIGGG